MLFLQDFHSAFSPDVVTFYFHQKQKRYCTLNSPYTYQVLHQSELLFLRYRFYKIYNLNPRLNRLNFCKTTIMKGLFFFYFFCFSFVLSFESEYFNVASSMFCRYVYLLYIKNRFIQRVIKMNLNIIPRGYRNEDDYVRLTQNTRTDCSILFVELDLASTSAS